MFDCINASRPDKSSRAPTAFPDFIRTASERETIETTCAAELAAWRSSYAYHHALPTIEAKMHNRRRFERAYDVLRDAYNAACEWTVEDILEHAG